MQNGDFKNAELFDVLSAEEFMQAGNFKNADFSDVWLCVL